MSESSRSWCLSPLRRTTGSPRDRGAAHVGGGRALGHCHGAWDVHRPAQALTACVDGDRRTTTGLVRLATLSRSRPHRLDGPEHGSRSSPSDHCRRSRRRRDVADERKRGEPFPGWRRLTAAQPGVETRHPGRYTGASSATLNFTLGLPPTTSMPIGSKPAFSSTRRDATFVVLVPAVSICKP